MSATEVREVATPGGPARLHVDVAPSEHVRLLVGHGAGGGVEAPDLLALAATLPARGVTVLRLEQPWRVAGRRLAGRPSTLDEAQRAVVATLGGPGATPLVLAGRSAGARSACRVAAQAADVDELVQAAEAGPRTAPPPVVLGVVCLAFPLHPPGRPERSRAGELHAVGSAGLPLHVVQGTRDAFGGPDQVRDAVGAGGTMVTEVLLGDHAFAVPVRAGRAAGTSTAAALHQVAEAVAEVVLDWATGATGASAGGAAPE